ncbi:MAG TPA: hypothetical protein VES73_03960 [Lamprocystis sp. (in: g-proteobacteria)]|nr:hypothetical protein [Lamprocystis sp. (in: g-proteobacteria)]
MSRAKILAIGNPWIDTHYTPNGWGCRCYWPSLAERDLKRLGKTGPDPTPEDGTYIHKDRNGVAHGLPAGWITGGTMRRGRRGS